MHRENGIWAHRDRLGKSGYTAFIDLKKLSIKRRDPMFAVPSFFISSSWIGFLIGCVGQAAKTVYTDFRESAIMACGWSQPCSVSTGSGIT